MSLVAVILLGSARRAAEQRGPDEIVILSAASDGALLVVLFLVAAAAHLRPGDLGFRRPGLWALADAATLAIGLWLLALVVSALSVSVFGPHPQSLIVSFQAHRGAVAAALDAVSSVLIAPFAEETLFRGVIFAALAQRLPLWAAAAGSALIFAAFHGLGVLLPIFALGLGLAYVYARTRTIWAPMVTHALVNGVSVAALFLQVPG